MKQIQTSEEQKRKIAEQLYLKASQEAPQQRSVIRHTRKPAVMIAAAVAATLCIGTITVGAATGWNYGALFERYFSHTANTAVSYDFTDMGGDLGEVFETDDYILTLESYIADTNSLYLYYDVKLKHDETIGKTEIREGRVFHATYPHMQYFLHGSDEPIFTGGSSDFLGQDEDGTVHIVERTMMPGGESLEGVSLDVCCEDMSSGLDGYPGNPEDKHTITLDTVYPAELHPLETPVILTVPNTGEEAEQNYAAVSPIGVYLTAGAEQQLLSAPCENGSFGATMGESASVTVHHTDGTEETLDADKMVIMAGDDTGVLTENVTLLSFNQPIPLDDVDYVTVNGTVIPVA